MLTLSISHNIFLTKEERYKLYEGQTIEIIGVSVPIWFKNGSTTEPGKEVFCQYRLRNKPPSKAIIMIKNGWEITLPNADADVIQDFFKKYGNEDLMKDIQSAKNLLDIKDGGSQWLQFRQYNKMKKNKKYYHILHSVEIKPVELLLSSCI